MQITKTLKEPVAGKTQVGLCSCSEIGPILQGMIRSLQAGGLLNHVGGCFMPRAGHDPGMRLNNRWTRHCLRGTSRPLLNQITIIKSKSICKSGLRHVPSRQ